MADTLKNWKRGKKGHGGSGGSGFKAPGSKTKGWESGPNGKKGLGKGSS